VHFAAPSGPTWNASGAFQGFHLYSIVEAEQACELLNGVVLAAKAAQMSNELYSSFNPLKQLLRQ
jgi:hypothetical protein